LACVEVLGRSVVERTVELLSRCGVNTISVLADLDDSGLSAAFRQRPAENVTLRTADNPCGTVGDVLREYAEKGIQTAVVARLGAYVELDAEELLHFHRQQNGAITRACDSQGPLDLWMVECRREETAIGFDARAILEKQAATFLLPGYVNRLSLPQDLRRLAVDAFQGRCKLSPAGKEIRPRIWVEDGARVHRRARIVAPAYIGRSSRIREDTVITRCSNVESFCEVDYGTVIENTSVLSNSYVGIWLDVSHAVVCGNRLLNLERDVTLDVNDASMLRKSIALRRDVSRVIPVEVAMGQLAFAPQE
jgi:NDP-sugar pyrophosphorylase family protein